MNISEKLDDALVSITGIQNFDGFETEQQIAKAYSADIDDALVSDVAAWLERESANAKPRTMDSYGAFRRELILQWDAIKRETNIEVVLCRQAEPYDYAQDMKESVSERGRILIRSTRHFEDVPLHHPLGSLAKHENGAYVRDSEGEALTHNDVFRTVHDLLTHCMGGDDVAFNTVGEYRATLMHDALFTYAAQPVLWNEAFAQVAYYDRRGAFPDPQKPCAMPRSLIHRLKR